MKIGKNKFDERAGSDLPISQQAAQLWISRSNLSYVPHPPSLREVAVSMDGRGRAMDNIFTERLWRTVKL